ncbi:TPA: Rib/alpha-like domain-containing protein, partial [Streptococcus suis]
MKHVKKKKLNRQEAFNFERCNQFSIRKLTIGVVSLAIGASMVLQNIPEVEAGVDVWTKTGEKITDHNGLTQENIGTIQYARGATPQKYSNFDTFRTTWTFEEVIEDGQKVYYVNVKHVFNEARDNYGRHFVVFNIPDSLYEPSAIVRKTYGNANNTTPTEVRNFTTWIQDPGSSASRWAESRRYVRVNPDGHAGNVEGGTVGTKQVSPTSITDRISIESDRWAHDWTRIDWRYQTDGNGVLDTSNVYNELIKNKSRSIYVDDRALSDHMVTYEYRARVKDYKAPMNHLLGYNQPAGGWNNYGAVFGTTPDNRPFKDRFPLTPPQRTIVDNLESLTEADKTAIKEKIKAANSSLFDNSNSTGKPVIASVANIEVPTNTTNGSKVVVTYTDGSKAELDAASVVTKKVVTPPPTTTTTTPIGNSTLKYKAENNGSGVNPNGNTPNTAISPVTEQWLNGWPGYPFSLPNGDQKSQMTRIQLREKTPVDMSTINNASSESLWTAKLNEVKADNKIGGSGTYPTGTVINGYGTHDANDNITYDMSVANQSTATIKKNSQGQIEGILIRGPRYDGQGVADAGLLTADMLFKQAPAADPLPGLKEQAKAEIDKLALSTTDKERFKQAVQNATDQAGIEKALADAKKAAADLANAKTAAKAEIDKLNYLTPEQKTNFKNAIDGLQSTGDITNKVNEAKAQDLANAKTNGSETVTGLQNLPEAEKTAFKNRIAQAATPADVQKIVEEATARDAAIEAARLAEAQKQAAKDAIDSIPGLTPEQKADFKNQIDQATDPRAIDTIVDTAKGTAQAETAKGQIEALPYLNNAQKAALKAAIDADKSLYNIEATLAEARELNNSMKYLQELVAQADNLKNTNQYTGATQPTKTAFDQALAAAKQVAPSSGQNADNQAVDLLIDNLKAGIAGLQAAPVEQQVNKDALRAEHGLGDQVKASGKYTGADEALKRAYDDALTKANEVLNNPSATQSEVDLALEKLIQAKHALNGSDIMTDATAPVISSPVVRPWSNFAVHGASTIGKKVAKPGVTATEADYGKGTTGLVELIVTDPESGVDVNSVQFTESTQYKLRALGLEYVKYDQPQANGAIGYFTTIGDGIVKDTGTENVDLHFTVANTDGVRSVEQTFIYTIKDDIAPTATPTEHILIKDQAYNLSIPFQDNSLFGREGGVTTGHISIKPEGNSPSEPLTPQALGVTNGTTASAFTLALTNPTPFTFSSDSDNRGERSNQGTVSFAGTPTATLARTTYKLRLGDGNAPTGSSENVSYNDITFTVVDQLQALSDTEKVPVNDPQRLTPAEKTAIINAVKAKNPQIAQTSANVVVTDDGQVTVTYPHGDRTDTLTATEVLTANPAPVFGTFGVDTNVNNQTNKTIFVFGAKKVNNAITETAPEFVPEKATAAIPVTDNTGIANLQLWKFNQDAAATDSGIALNAEGKLVSAFADNASNLKVQSPDTGIWHNRIKATDTGNPANSSISSTFRVLAYRDDVINTDAVQKIFGQAVTQQELEAKLGINVRSGVTVPTTDYTRKVVGYTPAGGEYKAVTDISQLPTSGNYTVKVETTNIYGQTIANNIAVDYNEQTDIITPVAPAADKPALIDNATVTSQEDKNAVIDALKAANPNTFPDGTSFEVAPDGTVTITYPDKSEDTVQVPIKQKDAAKYTPTAVETPIESSTATGTTLTPTERDAVKAAVTLPQGASGTVTVPETATVQEGTGTNAGKPVVLATVTYSDGTRETVEVPVKQTDAAKYTPTATATPIESLTVPGTVITPAEREAIKNAVTLPQGASGTVTVPEDASVRIGTKENAGKPVVLATVTYQDGTSETIEVPVKQKDTAKFTAVVTDENKPALISSSDAVDTPITDQTDKDAILAKVTVPAVNGQEASITSKEITSPVKEVDGKKVVEVTVTYEDGTKDKVNVPVDQKDSEANNPTVKDPDKPALISVPATENTPVTSEADKKAITDKVNVDGLPNTPTSVAVPDGATVAIVEGKPVVPVTVTYPDGTTDTINVPVKQA